MYANEFVSVFAMSSTSVKALMFLSPWMSVFPSASVMQWLRSFDYQWLRVMQYLTLFEYHRLTVMQYLTLFEYHWLTVMK